MATVIQKMNISFSVLRMIFKKGKALNSLKKLSIKSICGKYTLRKSIILISLCKFTLAADSGLGHISAALGIPTISFFGARFTSNNRTSWR